jgi:hypothetical protein
MVARVLTLLAVAAVVFVPAAGSTPLAGPSGLHAFLLRADDPPQDSYARTPSFAWAPYNGASSYDFQLSTSTRFDDRTLAWSSNSLSDPLRVPQVSVPLALPWMNGDQNALRQHALYARVRAHVGRGVTRWSAALGFDMQGDKPKQITPDIPGLVRWQPIDGATSYQVWFVNVVVKGLEGKVISTTTNVADEREYYAFHQDPSWSGTVLWRVRAVRQVYGGLPNGLPAVSYGPWSDTFVSVNPPVTTGTFLTPVSSVSDKVVDSTGAVAHQLTPGYAFDGDLAVNGADEDLYRVYVATDRQCVNVVYTGAVVGGPAYAPRVSGPLALPQTVKDLVKAEAGFLPDGSEGKTFSADSKPVTTSEQGDTATAAPPPPAPTGGTGAGGTSTLPPEFQSTGPFVDLWDLGRPNARYYWTVVPVHLVFVEDQIQYEDVTSPQDACEAGVVKEFSRTSEPTTTSARSPFASGLSVYGQLIAARTASPSFYRAPLVAWQPAKGAVGYEVQWSRTRAPWKPKGSVFTAATSTLLNGLLPGTWFYRVRGIDPYVPGPVKQMAWSTAVRLTISRPRFFDQSSVKTNRVKK